MCSQVAARQKRNPLKIKIFSSHLPMLLTNSKYSNNSKMKFTAAIALALATYTSAAVPSLTPANYDSMTDGKTVFIKFFAPW